MIRNNPINFPNERELNEKWLGQWNKDFEDQTKIQTACDRYLAKVKSLSSTERQRKLIDLIGYIDLTTLAGDDTKQRVSDLTDKAIKPLQGSNSKHDSVHCAAVCVYPARVVDVVERLRSKNVSSEKVGIASTAGGFPSGQYRLESRLLEVQLAVSDGATEIDIVINRAAALTDQWSLVHHEVSMMRLACNDKAHLKTILATGELGDSKRIYFASMVAMMAGSDFIKTSTGKETVNATLPVSYVMCQAIAHYSKLTGIKVGFKPAGGLRTADEALSYMFLVEDILGQDWLTSKLFRIGASTLLDNIVKEIGQS
jgi:deoxyribose-phosphate aldolase